MLRGYEEDSDDEDKVIYGEADEHSQAAFIQDETAVKIDWKSSFDSIAGYRQLKDKFETKRGSLLEVGEGDRADSFIEMLHAAAPVEAPAASSSSSSGAASRAEKPKEVVAPAKPKPKAAAFFDDRPAHWNQTSKHHHRLAAQGQKKAVPRKRKMDVPALPAQWAAPQPAVGTSISFAPSWLAPVKKTASVTEDEITTDVTPSSSSAAAAYEPDPYGAMDDLPMHTHYSTPHRPSITPSKSHKVRVGSLRWRLAKVVREGAEADNYFSTLTDPSAANALSMAAGLQDPRNRSKRWVVAEIMDASTSSAVCASCAPPFLCLTITIEEVAADSNGSADGGACDDIAGDAEDVDVRGSRPCAGDTCLALFRPHDPQAKALRQQQLLAGQHIKLYDPIALPVSPQARRMPWTGPPPRCLLLCGCAWELL